MNQKSSNQKLKLSHNYTSFTLKFGGVNTNLIDQTKNTTVSFSSSDSSKTAKVNMNLFNIDYLQIRVDPDNQVNEPKRDNFVIVPVIRNKEKAQLIVNTSNSKADEAIKEYLRLFVDETTVNPTFIISVGNPIENPNSTIPNSIGNYGWGYDTDKRLIKFNSQQSSNRPYIGLIGRDMSSSPKKIIIYGNRIDGTVAAVKRLVSARNQFLTTFGKSNADYLDDYDTLAISVFDLMHRNESVSDYDKDTQGFKDVVQNILNDNNYEISIKTVQTLNTTSYGQSSILRLKNVNSDFSPSFKDAVTNSSKPVVLSGGIFSNLLTWEEGKGLANDLVNKGYDVWEIEMTGSPQNECPTCSNYNYQDLVDFYWPTLIAGVEYYSGKSKLDYIGHSNGCRAALSSLDYYSSGKNTTGFAFNINNGDYDISLDLSNRPIDKFFGVACPATLNNNTFFVDSVREIKNGNYNGDLAIASINSTGLTHVKKSDYAKFLKPPIGGLLLGGSKISLNLMSFYNSLAINDNSSSPGNNVNVSELHLLFGTKDYNPITSNQNEDGVVPVSDLYEINKSVRIPNKYSSLISATHSGIISNNELKQYIIEGLE